MILKVDGSQMEWRSYLEWSQDPVGIDEIRQVTAGKIPSIHEANKSYFKLPTKLIAKTFLFRWIYRGSGWAFSHDPDFMHVSTSAKYWDKVIQAANEKYNVLFNFQEKLIERASNEEVIVIPSGREYKFKPSTGKGGELFWNVRDIVNYPNQGFAADLVTMARISARNRLRKFIEYKEKKILLFNTVHDDVEIDVDNNPEMLYNISITMEKVFEDIPKNFRKLYGYDFVTPMAGEVSFGMDLLNLTKFDNKKGPEQFYGYSDQSN